VALYDVPLLSGASFLKIKPGVRTDAQVLIIIFWIRVPICHLSPQVLEMIAPPYSPEFIQLFLPIVRNEEITGRLRSADRTDDVSLFLGKFPQGAPQGNSREL